MIATDRFVYVHLHKSGGTFVNECLLRFFPDARQIGYHLPRSRIPQDRLALPVLGFVVFVSVCNDVTECAVPLRQ
jgi:hypothetical protein